MMKRIICMIFACCLIHTQVFAAGVLFQAGGVAPSGGVITLLGDDTVYANSQALNQHRWYFSPYDGTFETATQSGTATQACTRFAVGTAAVAFKIAVYDGSNNLVGQTVEGTAAAGEVCVSCVSDITITASNNYRLALASPSYPTMLRGTGVDGYYDTLIYADGPPDPAVNDSFDPNKAPIALYLQGN